MHDKMNQQAFINTENRTLKWFLALFYTIFVFYEVYYESFYKRYLEEQYDGPGLGNYVTYLLLIVLLPIVLTLVKKKDKLFKAKYYFVACYFAISIFSEAFSNFYSSESLRMGNAVEVFLLLFSPIFVNTNFFWFVCTGLLGKYLLVGMLLRSTEVIFPMILVIILSVIAFVILKRFQVYVSAIQTSYNQQLEGIVKGIVATIELKDPYTRGHSERVAYYSKTLASSLNRFSKSELNSFYYACLLHDIGKVSIPDAILMKPGRLTSEEYEIIKTHPAVGTEAIRKVDGLNMSIDVIKYHHERWDGTGYPDRLSGKNIPLLARVVTIADAFDAMTSSRSYRSALSVEDAYDRIVEGKGSQFDPDLVEAFKKAFPDWVKFHESYEWSHEFPLQNMEYEKEVK
jgi:HD-GYP domain-containing protein (c-di-GMP phosphodiesterase class II)